MWTITEKQYTNEDGESYTGYGVEFGKCLVEDITPSRTAIQQFADALNRFDASPVHIYEIIESSADFDAPDCADFPRPCIRKPPGFPTGRFFYLT